MAERLMWNIAEPKPADAERIAHFQSVSWYETYCREGQKERNAQVKADADAFLFPERIKKRQSIIDQLNPSRDFMRVAELPSDEEIVGLLYGYRDIQRQELLVLYVAPFLHGRGVAQELTKGFIEWADNDRPIEVSVVDDNERAQRFYRKMGFAAIDGNHRPLNSYLTELTMERESDFKGGNNEI